MPELDLTTAEYVFVGACLLFSLVACWKGEGLLGLGLFGVAVLLYWVMVRHGRTDWMP